MKYDLSDYRLSKELELMLICSNYQISDTDLISAKKLYADIDLSTLQKVIVKHRLFTFEYRNFMKLSRMIKIDEGFLSFLSESSKSNQLNTMQYTTELIRLNKIFTENNIHYITLKGPLLSYELYGDIGLRYSKDIDILIDLLDFDKIYALLLNAGYKNIDFEKMTDKQKRFAFKNDHHITMSSNRHFIVELHWRIHEVFDLPFYQLWNNKSEINLFGNSFYIPCKTDNLIFLIVHGSKHGWMRLKWLTDIRDILLNGSQNLKELYARADELKCSDMLSQTLLLLDLFFHTDYKNDQTTSYQIKLTALSLPLILSDKDTFEFGTPYFLPYTKYLLLFCKTPMAKTKYLSSFLKPKKKDFDGLKSTNFFAGYYLFRFHRLLKKFLHIK
jgi:hypothetical protein